jgi:signal transduction histidine kinase
MDEKLREIAHRFNNVLMAIQPHAEIIKRAGKDNQRILDSVAQIESALKRAKQITDEMREQA